jgi:holo-[acyl-carrier protein] synthase
MTGEEDGRATTTKEDGRATTDEKLERTARASADDRLRPVVHSGVDTVSIPRIAALLAEFGDSFARRAFAPREREYCERRPDPVQHYAARWAAKEAFLKALGEARPTVSLDEIAVARKPEGPHLALGPEATAALDRRFADEGADPDRTDVSVSLSHDRDGECATAHVVAVGARGAEAGSRATADGGDRP